MEFGAFAEEYREVGDGSGHLLRILRVVRGFEALKSASHEYHYGYLLALIKSKQEKLSQNESELSRNKPPLSLKTKITAVR
jgi:hypothetical protein